MLYKDDETYTAGIAAFNPASGAVTGVPVTGGSTNGIVTCFDS